MALNCRTVYKALGTDMHWNLPYHMPPYVGERVQIEDVWYYVKFWQHVLYPQSSAATITVYLQKM